MYSLSKMSEIVRLLLSEMAELYVQKVSNPFLSFIDITIRKLTCVWD